MLARKERPAKSWRNAQRTKEIIGDHHCLYVARFSIPCHVVFRTAPERLVASHFLERLCVPCVFLIRADIVGGGRKSALSVIARKPNKSFGVRKGKRAKQKGVHYAEDSNVGANAKGECQDGDG